MSRILACQKEKKGYVMRFTGADHQELLRSLWNEGYVRPVVFPGHDTPTSLVEWVVSGCAAEELFRFCENGDLAFHLVFTQGWYREG